MAKTAKIRVFLREKCFRRDLYKKKLWIILFSGERLAFLASVLLKKDGCSLTVKKVE